MGTAIQILHPGRHRAARGDRWALRRRRMLATGFQGALDDARRRGWRIVPQCPFVAEFIAEHPEYADLVAAPTFGHGAG
jgi:hypothetical protein